MIIKNKKAIYFVILLQFLLFCFSCMSTKKMTNQEQEQNLKKESNVKDEKITENNGNLNDKTIEQLSGATKLLLKAIDNYVEILPNSKKTPEVILLKGQTYYDNKMYKRARESFNGILKRYMDSEEVPEAVKLTAQTYYEEEKFDEAKKWYEKLKTVSSLGKYKEEASVRIAESYYKIAEKYRKSGEVDKAINEFEKIVIEYPNSEIADIALYNVGLLYIEKEIWSKAILTFNKLIANYENSKYIEKALFNTAKCYENIGNWSKAAITYVEIFKRFPKSKQVKTALYNAGLAYEKEKNFVLAASIYEKYANTWSTESDAPDVLFKAGELYGKLKDWKNVEKVNSLFSKRYGRNKDRIVMALCMTGIAYYMQKKYNPAIQQFNNTINTARKLGLNTKSNSFYAAKAQYTIGEIYQTYADKIKLKLGDYKRLLSKKIKFTEMAVNAYTDVSTYKIIEWTTQSLYRMGEAFEKFGLAIHRRERPKNQSYMKMLAFEEGIANAVETYLAEKALNAHEQNVKLGIKYEYDDEWTKRSRNKLTKLPYLSALNYTKLIEIADLTLQIKDDSNPMRIIQKKLEHLQNVAPFQSSAIKLYLKTLEIASTYGIDDKYKIKASSAITKMSYSVGKTYAEVVKVAMGAPIPSTYDNYKTFFYKVNLLTEGVVDYENSAIQALYKNIKIGEAYDIKDEWILKSKEKIAEILFKKSYCYEILAHEALRNPPIPQGSSQEEADEYKIQFEDLAFKLQDEAFNIYRDILSKAEDSITKGKYLDFSYIRLFINFPDEFGTKYSQDTTIVITSGKEWLFSSEYQEGWYNKDFDYSKWKQVKKGTKIDTSQLLGFTKPVVPIWGGQYTEDGFEYYNKIFVVREFYAKTKPRDVAIEFSVTGDYQIYFNGDSLRSDSLEISRAWFRCRKKNKVDQYFDSGKNIIAAELKSNERKGHAFYVYFKFRDKIEKILPKLPSMEKAVTFIELKNMDLSVPKIKNFETKNTIFTL